MRYGKKYSLDPYRKLERAELELLRTNYCIRILVFVRIVSSTGTHPFTSCAWERAETFTDPVINIRLRANEWKYKPSKGDGMTLLRAQLLPITSSKRKKNDWTYKRLHTWSYSNKVESKVVLRNWTAKGREFERKCEI